MVKLNMSLLNKILILMTVLFCMNVGLVYAQEINEDDYRNDDYYRIVLDPEQGQWDVTGTIKNLDSQETICLPAFGQRYGEKLEVLEIAGLDGRNINIRTDEYGCFRPAAGLDGLRIRYLLKMREPEEGRYWVASGLSALHRGNMLVYPGESVFLERSGGAEDIKTNVELFPPDLRDSVVSTLEDVGLKDGGRQFRANHSFELNRSYWATGMAYVRTFIQEETSWTIAIAEQWRGGIVDIEGELKRILGYYRSLMGARTPNHLSIYVFPADFDTNYQHGFARPGGLILQMGQKAARQPENRRLLLAHELFHLYNGESLQYHESEYIQTAWFREGMTQYIAFQALFSLGLASMKYLYQWITTCYNQLNADRQGTIRLSEQERAYYHGFMLSMAMDNQWLAYHTTYHSTGFFGWLSTTGYWDKKLTNAMIADALSEYSSFDYSDFVKYYITGNQTIPLESILKVNQMCIYEIKSIQYHLGVSYRTDVQNARLVADFVEPGSVADQAGIRPGDILVPSDQMDWRDGSAKIIRILRQGRDVQMRIPVFGVPTVSTEVRGCQ